MRRWLLTPLVATLFLVSFAESWAALTDAALAAKIPHPGPWPIMVDGFIVAMALSVIEADREHRGKVAVWPRVGLLVATALSTGIQAAWAPVDDWAWALHAWSPLAVLFSFECLVWLWRPAWDVPSAPEPSVDPQPATVPAPENPHPLGPEHPPTQPKGRRPTYSTTLTPSQRAEAVRMFQAGETAKAVQRALNLTERAYKFRLLPLAREIEESKALAGTNGHGGRS